jgi:hypothetical protein
MTSQAQKLSLFSPMVALKLLLHCMQKRSLLDIIGEIGAKQT